MEPDIAPTDVRLTAARAETRAAFEARALAYLAIHEELVDELGPTRAREVLRSAIRRRGLDMGGPYEHAAAAGDLAAVGRVFCESSACGGELFHPGVEERDDERVVLRMTACPLVDAWRRTGAPSDVVDRMCEIASAIDEGMFEAAGLEARIIERLGRPGCTRCLIEVRLP